MLNDWYSTRARLQKMEKQLQELLEVGLSKGKTEKQLHTEGLLDYIFDSIRHYLSDLGGGIDANDSDEKLEPDYRYFEHYIEHVNPDECADICRLCARSIRACFKKERAEEAEIEEMTDNIGNGR